jgi:mannitol 2-dehydrogenase
VLPVIRDAVKAGTPIEGLALSQGLWARMCEGTRENGTIIEANDPEWDRLSAQARKAKDDPGAWLAMDDIYGELGRNPRFSEAFTKALGALWDKGTEAVLRDYAGSEM